ncbi:hypothetical protein A9Q99_09760 [Gammaproteobacteria bacterium 45_16_T64]|nr:hypothetical protein A9Q99_09760 [Gammaproteobacteria bacterium 45_16_T64]
MDNTVLSPPVVAATLCCPSNLLILLTEQTSLDDLDAALCQSLTLLFDAIETSIDGHPTGTSCTLDVISKKYHIGFDGDIREYTDLEHSGKGSISAADDVDHIDICVIGEQSTPSSQAIQQLLRIYQNQEFHLTRSTQDKLTNLLNRQAYSEKIDHLFRSSGLSQRASDIRRVMAMVDIDNFKSINDQYGHLFGDEILVLISRLMEKSFRVDDWLIRFGGEEFIIILHDVDLQTAAHSLDRFRKNIEQFPFPQLQRVTVSIGFTQLDLSLPHTQLLGRTDQALYYSKKNGRNQCNEYESLLSEHLLDEVDHESDIELF